MLLMVEAEIWSLCPTEPSYQWCDLL